MTLPSHYVLEQENPATENPPHSENGIRKTEPIVGWKLETDVVLEFRIPEMKRRALWKRWLSFREKKRKS
jgi:hypothetical protein